MSATLQTTPLDRLTPCERGVLHLVAEGLFNCEVAERLCVSEHTVKFHLGHAFEKLGVRNRVEAAITYHVWTT